MTNSKHKAGKVMLALALVLVMAAAMAVPVFAEPEPVPFDRYRNDVAIAKVLSMPKGTATPGGITFTFDITPVDYNGMSNSTRRMPPAFTRTITFDAGDAFTDFAYSKTLRKEVKVFQRDITFATGGVYHFAVTERMTVDADELGYPINPQTEALLLDTSVYDIYAYVENMLDYSGTYLHTIIIKRSEDQGELSKPGQPGRPGEPADPNAPGAESLKVKEMVFTNEFTRQHGPTDEDPRKSDGLNITKTVDGLTASHEAYFSYVLNVFKPEQQIRQESYRAYIMHADKNGALTNAITDSAAARAHGVEIKGGGTYGYYVEVPHDGSNFTFKLKHGDRLVFTDIHVGARYKLIENGVKPWVPNFSAQINDAIPSSSINSETGVNMKVTDQYGNEEIFIAEGRNGAYFTNKWDFAPPTGLNENNPTFLAMLAPLGALGGAAAVCRRKRAVLNK